MLYIYNIRIIFNFIVKLGMTAVDGIHLFCPVLQQAVGEPSGGSPNIKADFVLYINRKPFNGCGKLVAAPGDILL